MNNYTVDMGPVVTLTRIDDPWAYDYIRNPFAESPAVIGSFESYIRGHYQDQYFTVLEESLNSGYLPVSGRYVTDPDIEYVTIRDITLDTLEFFQQPESIILVSACISLKVTLITETIVKTTPERYMIIGTVSFKENGDTIFDLFQEITPDHKITIPNKLTKYLIPIIRSEEYEDRANKILMKYYPEALSDFRKVDAAKLASRIGLKVKYLKMTSDASVLGRLFFETDIIDYYDNEGRLLQARIPAKTIVVDYDACSRFHEGKVAQTILHECAHYLEHFYFYCVQHLYNSDIRYLNCGAKAGAAPDHDSPIFWIEKQADLLGFALQMPKASASFVLEGYCRKNFSCDPEHANLSMLERAVKYASEYFGVSRRCAQVRLQVLGYKNLQGLFNYVNGKYVRSYLADESCLKNGQTLTISLKGAADEYHRNEHFRMLLDSGKYIYVEGHFCLDKSKYLYKDRNGTKRLTTYARTHMDECCLIFQTHSTFSHSYKEGSLNKECTSGSVITYPGKSTAEAGATQETPAIAALRIMKILNDPNLPRDFAGTLCYHMDRLNVKRGSIAEETGWDDKTIQRYRNREDRPADIKAVIALCIVLKLDPELSMDLIDKAGYRLRDSQEDLMYAIILRSMYTATLIECNNALISCGMKPLVKMAA